MKDLGEGETPLSDGGLSLPKPLLLSPNFAEPNLIHSAYQVARLRGVARGGFLYAGMRFGSAKFFVFLEGIFWGMCGFALVLWVGCVWNNALHKCRDSAGQWHETFQQITFLW